MFHGKTQYCQNYPVSSLATVCFQRGYPQFPSATVPLWPLHSHGLGSSARTWEMMGASVRARRSFNGSDLLLNPPPLAVLCFVIKQTLPATVLASSISSAHVCPRAGYKRRPLREAVTADPWAGLPCVGLAVFYV